MRSRLTTRLRRRGSAATWAPYDQKAAHQCVVPKPLSLAFARCLSWLWCGCSLPACSRCSCGRTCPRRHCNGFCSLLSAHLCICSASHSLPGCCHGATVIAFRQTAFRSDAFSRSEERRVGKDCVGTFSTCG